MVGVCMSFANMYTSEALFAQGCVRVSRVEDQTWSFVLLNLHGKFSLSCSPSTKSCKWYHKTIVISLWVYKPPPCVTWGNYCVSDFWNGPRGGCCIIVFNASNKSFFQLTIEVSCPMFVSPKWVDIIVTSWLGEWKIIPIKTRGEGGGVPSGPRRFWPPLNYIQTSKYK
jgi:hypothetical protein